MEILSTGESADLGIIGIEVVTEGVGIGKITEGQRAALKEKKLTQNLGEHQQF